MAIFRTKGDETYDMLDRDLTTQPDEWKVEESIERIDEQSWESRYVHEAKLIQKHIDKHNIKKVLELGSGPGVLGDKISRQNTDLLWTNVDKQAALDIHKERKFKGRFLVKDLMNEFDLSDLDNDYDLIVANDFLEHIANPSDVLYQAHKITTENAKMFISVPNWRMGHVFIYRGLFDYDNWLYTMRIHGWDVTTVSPANIQCQHLPKLDSESAMPDELIQSWNWFFCATRRTKTWKE